MSPVTRKAYRFLSGIDDAAFCQRVSDALAEGYVLYGNPVMVAQGSERIVGQAIVDPAQVSAEKPHCSERHAEK